MRTSNFHRGAAVVSLSLHGRGCGFRAALGTLLLALDNLVVQPLAVNTRRFLLIVRDHLPHLEAGPTLRSLIVERGDERVRERLLGSDPLPWVELRKARWASVRERAKNRGRWRC